MLHKVTWLVRGLVALLNPKSWGVFQETYKKTKFDAAFTPSWSQAGEDISLELIVNSDESDQFYLDIGAHDPNRFSVTRKLYDIGWRGINVDGNPGYESKFKKYRKMDLFLNVCVGFEKEYEFSIFTEGAISSTNPEWVKKFISEGAELESRIKVRGMTLREIIDLPNVPNRVTFINIDIEGADEDALKSIQLESLPIGRFPKWLLLETSPPVGSALNFPAVKYAITHGYVPWLVLPMATLLKAPQAKIVA